MAKMEPSIEPSINSVEMITSAESDDISREMTMTSSTKAADTTIALPTGGIPPLPSQRAQMRFARALDALRRTLERVPREVRRQAIQSLSCGLRDELLRFMEAHATSRSTLRDSVHSAELATCSGAITLKRRGSAATASQLLCSGSPAVSARHFGGIVTVHTGLKEYHRVRCQIGGVVVRSRGMPRREQAQAKLVRLRSMANVNSDKCDLTERLSAAEQAFSDPGFNSFDMNAKGSGLSFAVVLDARRWIGRSIMSPSIASAQEAASCRQEACEAEIHGWSSVRSLWLRWLQVQRPRRWSNGARSEMHLQTLLAVADATYSERAKRMRTSVSGCSRYKKQASTVCAERVLAKHCVRNAFTQRSTRLERMLARSVEHAQRSLAKVVFRPASTLRAIASKGSSRASSTNKASKASQVSQAIIIFKRKAGSQAGRKPNAKARLNSDYSCMSKKRHRCRESWSQSKLLRW